MKYDYIKAILYAYPSLGEIGEAVGASAEHKALLSYKNPRSTEELALEIMREISAKEALSELSSLVDTLLGRCTREELYLLEYKYFRRKEALGSFAGYSLSCSERSYFRKQNRLLKKAAEFFGKRGWTQERFLSETNGLFTRVMAALENGMERKVPKQRKRGRARCHSSV